MPADLQRFGWQPDAAARRPVHTLRLLVQGLRQLAVNLELIDNTFRQSRAVFRQQFSAFQRSLCFALTLTVELIAQSLQVSVELLTLFSASSERIRASS